MKRIIILSSILLAFSFTGFSQVNKILGKWTTIDDKDGSAKSIVSIFKATNGKYYGKVEKLFKDPERVCKECEGTNKNQPIAGMTIINSMIESDNKLTGGTILDPKNGKIYKCNISMDSSNPDKLTVRGSLDKSGWLGRSQTWQRVK